MGKTNDLFQLSRTKEKYAKDISLENATKQLIHWRVCVTLVAIIVVLNYGTGFIWDKSEVRLYSTIDSSSLFSDSYGKAHLELYKRHPEVKKFAYEALDSAIKSGTRAEAIALAKQLLKECKVAKTPMDLETYVLANQYLKKMGASE